MSKQENAGSDFLQFSYSKKARSFLRKHENIRDRFEENIENYYFKGRTEGIDIRKMSGSSRWIRMRIDSYRIIYAIVRGRLIIVDVILAGNRREVYKQYSKRTN